MEIYTQLVFMEFKADNIYSSYNTWAPLTNMV